LKDSGGNAWHFRVRWPRAGPECQIAFGRVACYKKRAGTSRSETCLPSHTSKDRESMLHSQDNDKPTEGQDAPRENPIVIRYYRAINAARFNHAETWIICLLFEEGWRRPRMAHGATKAMPIRLCPKELASFNGISRSHLYRTIKNLSAGRVILRNEQGDWRINPFWREWTYADGRPRIPLERHEYITWPPGRPYFKVVSCD
jgi:AraC-like DNA-binding protein